MKIGHHIFELKLIAQGPRSDPRAEKIAAAKQFAGEAGLSVAWNTPLAPLASKARRRVARAVNTARTNLGVPPDTQPPAA